MTYEAADIIAIGGKEWRTATKHRVYLNNWQELAGLEIEHYKSGNICSATLDGERISNSRAAKLAAGSIYWEAGTLRAQGVDPDLTARVAAAVAQRVANQ